MSDQDNATAADDALTAAISEPKRVSSDAGSYESHSLSELIEADKYQHAKAAGSSASRGLRITKLILPGTA